MQLEVAYAIYNGQFYPSYASTDGSQTALLRLADLDAGGEPVNHSDPSLVNWAKESNDLLKKLGPFPPTQRADAVLPESAGTELPDGSPLSGLPWYVAFWIQDPQTGTISLWAGRFLADSVGVGNTTEDGGVYAFLSRQSIEMGEDGTTPVRKSFRAVRSLLFPTFDSVSGDTSQAKEQGCSVDQTDLSKIAPWPTNG